MATGSSVSVSGSKQTTDLTNEVTDKAIIRSEELQEILACLREVVFHLRVITNELPDTE